MTKNRGMHSNDPYLETDKELRIEFVMNVIIFREKNRIGA